MIHINEIQRKYSDADKKKSDTSALVRETDYNDKITETVVTLHSVTNLATTSALTGVENKKPGVGNFVKNITMWKNQTLNLNTLLQLIFKLKA